MRGGRVGVLYMALYLALYFCLTTLTSEGVMYMALSLFVISLVGEGVLDMALSFCVLTHCHWVFVCLHWQLRGVLHMTLSLCVPTLAVQVYWIWLYPCVCLH